MEDFLFLLFCKFIFLTWPMTILSGVKSSLQLDTQHREYLFLTFGNLELHLIQRIPVLMKWPFPQVNIPKGCWSNAVLPLITEVTKFQKKFPGSLCLSYLWDNFSCLLSPSHHLSRLLLVYHGLWLSSCPLQADTLLQRKSCLVFLGRFPNVSDLDPLSFREGSLSFSVGLLSLPSLQGCQNVPENH